MHGDQLVALIKDRCRRRNLTEAEFSQAVAGHGTVIADIRRGRTPSAKRLEKICEVLGLDFYVGPPREAESIPPKIAEALGLSTDAATVEEALKAIEARREPEISAIRGHLRSAEEDLDRVTNALDQALRRAEVVPGSFSGLDDADAVTRPSVSAKVIEFPDVRDPESVSYRFRMLPKREVKGAAGNGTYVEGELVIGYLAFREDWLLKRGINYKKADIIEVLGKSMEPTLQDGSMILIDHQRTRRLADRVFAVRSDDLLLIKRLVHDNHDWLLVSDNEAYPPVPWPREAVVIGQVMWTGRTLR